MRFEISWRRNTKIGSMSENRLRKRKKTIFWNICREATCHTGKDIMIDEIKDTEKKVKPRPFVIWRINGRIKKSNHYRLQQMSKIQSTYTTYFSLSVWSAVFSSESTLRKKVWGPFILNTIAYRKDDVNIVMNCGIGLLKWKRIYWIAFSTDLLKRNWPLFRHLMRQHPPCKEVETQYLNIFPVI